MARYIDADSLIKTVNGFTKFYHLDRLHVGTFIDAVVDMPDADVKPVVRGEWIEDIHEPFASTYNCSNCGKEPLLEYVFVLSRYCPYCGAEMKEKA